ncbi:MAG TPA: hypothetical protein VEJ20_10005 [Candidatus Eremiobacteraceae bacterium]|nr:hypothetical protein [Candidatus Eremiobacteraceae bacterium]
MGYLIDPPERVEGRYVAVFRQTDVADALAVEFLRDNGIDVRTFPLVGDLAFEAFGGLGGGTSMFGGQTLVCVPEADADEALDLLEFDSGLVEFDDEDDGEEEP